MGDMARLVNGIEDYCADAASLARLEAEGAAKGWARDAALWAACGALLVLGYALATAGVVSSLAHSIGAPWALLSVGGANAIAGALLAWALLARPRVEAARGPDRPTSEGGL